MEIRNAIPDDAASIAAINVAAWRAAYGGLVEQGLLNELDVDVRGDEWRSYLEAPGPDERMLLVVEDGVVLGYTRTGPARDFDLDPRETAEVYALYVDPASWGRGAGRRLMDVAIEDLTRRRFGSVVLWVVAANERARRFYERAGFKHDGRDDKPFFGAAQVRYRTGLALHPSSMTR